MNSPELFQIIEEQLANQARALVTNAEQKALAANKKHFDAVRAALDILRNENAVEEAERDPAFRERVREQVRRAQREQKEVERLSSV